MPHKYILSTAMLALWILASPAYSKQSEAEDATQKNDVESASSGAVSEMGMQVVAPTKPTQQEIDLANEDANTRLLGNKMLGHVSLATLALELGMNDVALDQIAHARKLANELETDRPTVSINSKFKYGKVSYTSESMNKDYYIPLVDDLILVRDFKKFSKERKKEKIAETNAEVVRLTVDLDIREAIRKLDEAKAAISADNSGEAATDLIGIFDASVVVEEVIKDPLWSVYDNLALANAMIQEGQFKTARFAVKRAKTGLKALEKEEKFLKQSEEVKATIVAMDRIEKELKSAAPTHIEKAKNDLSDALAWVRSLF